MERVKIDRRKYVVAYRINPETTKKYVDTLVKLDTRYKIIKWGHDFHQIVRIGK